jgi:hypothetical protein
MSPTAVAAETVFGDGEKNSKVQQDTFTYDAAAAGFDLAFFLTFAIYARNPRVGATTYSPAKAFQALGLASRSLPARLIVITLGEPAYPVNWLDMLPVDDG